MPPPALSSSTDDAAVAATCASHGLAPADFAALREHAVAAKAAAYCPYSRFRVGAALLLAGGGAIVSGANVENASYPAGTCAERVALATAVTSPAWRPAADAPRVRALALATDVSPPASPCGMCRQL